MQKIKLVQLSAVACALAVNPPAHADNIFVSNFGDTTIEKFDTNGQATSLPTSSLHGPTGLAVNSFGQLFIADDDTDAFGNDKSRVMRFDIASGNLEVFISQGFDFPAGLACNADFLCVGNLGNNSITVFNFATGTVTNIFPTGINQPTGLAFGADGNLYVANFSGNSIEKFTVSGGVLNTNGTTFASSGLNAPYCLAFDKNCDLYVSNNGNNTIEKLDSAGNDLGVFANSGLNAPVGLAFDRGGNLYVANNGNNTIEKFAFSGGALSTNGTTFASSGLNLPGYIAVQPPPLPIPLNIQLSDTNAVLTWTNISTVFSLQRASAVAGPYTNVPGAFSPYESAITGKAMFFRLMSN